MILAHVDSHGNRWYFRFAAPPSAVARISRKLTKKAGRVRGAKNAAELSRALLAEAVALADYQAYHGAAPQDYEAAPVNERYAAAEV